VRLLTLSNCSLDSSQGSGYVILGFIDGLRRRGWTVDVIGPDQLDPFPTLGHARSWRIALGMWRHAERALQRADYDVVEFYGGEAWLAISRLTRRRRRSFLVVCHSNGLEPSAREQHIRHLGSDTLTGGPRRWYQIDHGRLAATGFRRADGLVTVSEYDRRYALERDYQPAAHLLAIDNPLPDSFLGQPLALEREPRVVFCGSWIARKGIALLVRDMTRLLAELPQARLRLIGVGGDFSVTAHFPSALQDRIEVFPFIADKQALRAAYRECAILIAPSAYESFGLTAAEAMACGCALVSSRTGFAAGLTDGREASLLDSPTSPRLYERVRELLLNDARRCAIARAGYERVQSLEWSGAVRALALQYEAWLAERRATASVN
jgi:glycosyltransferase involved in cell wall biosynthesis